MKRLLKLAVVVALCGAALVLFTVLAAIVFVRSTLPKTSGSVRIAGLSAPVTVLRDRWGVPAIRASTVDDAMAALGYLHASERMWQMELRRRAAFGRLSEVFGSLAVETDFQNRAYGLEALATADLAALRPEMRRILDAYALGVNRFIGTHRFRLPPEFVLLRFRPEPWRAEDSVAFGRMMLAGLSLARRFEMNRYENFLGLGARHALDLMRLQSDTAHPFRPPEIAEYFQETPSIASLRSADTPGSFDPLAYPAASEEAPAGSNSWAIDGRATASGLPLLANDPHLGIEQPSVWHEVVIIAPGLEARGLSLPGVPGLLIGRNRHVAWGITVHQADDADVFIEHLQGPPPLRYQEGNRWLAVSSRLETVRVRGSGSVSRTLVSTGHGLPLSDDRASMRPALSFRLAPLEGKFPIETFWSFMKATDAREILDILRGYEGTALNFTYADDRGAIGFKTAGAVPRRRAGDGRLPAPGWTGTYGWNGWISFDELPGDHREPGMRSSEPPVVPSGDDLAGGADPFVVTANNCLVPSGSADFGDWAPPFRARRIAEMLRERRPWSLDALRAVQTDVTSLLARRSVVAIEKILAGSTIGEEARRGLDALRGWNGAMELRVSWES